MPSHFGPRVIGDAAYAAEEAQRAIGALHFGARVTGVEHPGGASPDATPPDGATAPETVPHGAPAPEEATAQGGLSIAALTEALAENGALVDEFWAAELRRAEGPRKGAVRALLAAEVGKPGGGRPKMVAVLTEALK